MIDPLTGAALADSLAGITAQMSGMSLADAYNQRMTDTYTDASGLEIGVGDYTDNKPSISGNTSNTIIDSQDSDPSEAFSNYETAGGVIDSTTGGFIYGSLVNTTSYSLLDTQAEIKAVAPVAVGLNTAIAAISQSLGVSMKINEVDPLLADKFVNALVRAGCVYDKANDLVTAWWDGVHMLFPKKAVEAVQDVIDAEEIGNEQYSYSDEIPSGFLSGTYSYEYSGSAGGVSYNAVVVVNVDHPFTSWFTENGGVIHRLVAGTSPESFSGEAVTTTKWRDGRITTNVSSLSGTLSNSYTHNGLTVYYSSSSGRGTHNNPTGVNASAAGSNGEMAWALVYGTTVQEGYPEGMKQSLAPAYTPSTIPSAGGVAHKIDGGQGIDTVEVVPISLPEDPEDTTESTTDPISTPTTPEQEQELPAPPIPTPVPDTNISNPDVPLVDSSVINSTLINELVEELANTLDPQPEQSSGIIPFPWLPGSPVIDPGTGEQTGTQYPSIVPASGSGLIHVYNPTPAEFVGFGNWLWVTYADATIDKIWNNPFDGIIGAHELYSTPQVDGRDNIRSGFLVCPVTSDLVRQRYTEFDCGTVVIPEFYGNYFDYSPYSQAYIYLPFIGINEVSIDDIVGHAVNIRYRVDAYNGSCIAMIYVAKNGYRNLCYQFAGNCAVEVPLAGGSQAAIKAGMLQAEAYARATVQSAQIQKTASIGSGIVHGAAAGSGAGPLGGILGALAGGTAGYIQGAANYGAAKLQAGAMQEAARYANKSSVQHSGQFGLSHGAMGLKIPFIMIRNPIQVKVVNYNDDYGFPAHKRVIIGGCTGYLRVREVNVVSAHATNEEKRAIEEALKQGVYVTP